MDVTMQVIEAQDARSRMQEAKKRIKAEVRRKYEARINQEVAERSQEAEIEFAKTLARVHASGVSQAILRRDVLRTNVWGVWTYWRDLAEIEPERVSVANAKAARERANATVDLSDDRTVLTVRKNSRGEEVGPIRYDLSTLRKVRGGLWWPDTENEIAEREAVQGDDKFLRMLSDEIQRQIDAGAIANPEEEG